MCTLSSVADSQGMYLGTDRDESVALAPEMPRAGQHRSMYQNNLEP
jgi:hypothetical protein